MASQKKPVRSRSKPEQKRAQILGEATRIIGERGYNGFGIQELARCCQLTNAGLLHYFGSKDKLLIALLEERDRLDTEAVSSMLDVVVRCLDDPGEVPLDTVYKSMHAIVERNSTQPQLVRLYAVLGAEALNEGHPARDYFLSREARALDIFTRMVEAHVPDPRSTARQLLALMAGLESQWLRTNQGFDLVAEWDRGVSRILPPPGGNP